MDRHPTILERSPIHESDDRHVPGGPGGDCRHCGSGAAQSRSGLGNGEWRTVNGEGACPLSPPTNNRGLIWVMGSFLFCPCHLPLTLGLAATLLAGTAA